MCYMACLSSSSLRPTVLQTSHCFRTTKPWRTVRENIRRGEENSSSLSHKCEATYMATYMQHISRITYTHATRKSIQINEQHICSLIIVHHIDTTNMPINVPCIYAAVAIYHQRINVSHTCTIIIAAVAADGDCCGGDCMGRPAGVHDGAEQLPPPLYAG
jgi:hypothetical protein